MSIWKDQNVEDQTTKKSTQNVCDGGHDQLLHRLDPREMFAVSMTYIIIIILILVAYVVSMRYEKIIRFSI